jgi:hypothetical protein
VFSGFGTIKRAAKESGVARGVVMERIKMIPEFAERLI